MEKENRIELPKQKGFYRTPFGIYAADHKAPPGMIRDETFAWIYADGAAPINNMHSSMILTLTKEELEKIENPEIREETKKAQELMLDHPSFFVNLMAIGNRTLIEPYRPDGLCKIELEKPLETGYIEVYDHDIRKIKLGEAQAKYNNAKLWIDESAKVDDIRYAVRGGDWGAGGWRFGVGLGYGPRDSSPSVAGLGFRLSGNEAYMNASKINVSKALEELASAGKSILAAENLLK